MPAELIDFSKLVQPDLRIRLVKDGPEYRVPADPPVAWLLAFRGLEKVADDGDELELVERIRDLVLDLIKIRQPKVSEKTVTDALDALGVATLVQAIGRIYSDLGGEEEVAEAAPPPKPKAGTRNGRSARSKASASSSS